jgi:Tol biopolymer transport system component
MDSAGNIGGIDPGNSNSGKLIIPIQRPNSNHIYIYNKNTKELGYGSLNKNGTNWNIGSISFLSVSNVDTTAYCFSPNGKKIAYVSQLDKEIYVMDYNGGTPEKISHSGINQSPSWSKK